MTLRKCFKCKAETAKAIGNQREWLCGSCLHKSLLSKFKSAVHQNKLISRGDRVLLAFSGGHASRAALDFLLAIKFPPLPPMSDSRPHTAPVSSDFLSRLSLQTLGPTAKGRIPFRLCVAFVDERSAVGPNLLPDDVADRLALEVRQIAAEAFDEHVAQLGGNIARKPQNAESSRVDLLESISANGEAVQETGGGIEAELKTEAEVEAEIEAGTETEKSGRDCACAATTEATLLPDLSSLEHIRPLRERLQCAHLDCPPDCALTEERVALESERALAGMVRAGEGQLQRNNVLGDETRKAGGGEERVQGERLRKGRGGEQFLVGGGGPRQAAGRVFERTSSGDGFFVAVPLEGALLRGNQRFAAWLRGAAVSLPCGEDETVGGTIASDSSLGDTPVAMEGAEGNDGEGADTWLLAKNRLQSLLTSASDITGRQDLVEALRTRLLRRVAAAMGCTKVIVGDNATRLAARIIADVAKGRGFGLPAGIAVWDGRDFARRPDGCSIDGGYDGTIIPDGCRIVNDKDADHTAGSPVAIARPLRDCLLPELAMHCHLARLRTAFVPNLYTSAVAGSAVSRGGFRGETGGTGERVQGFAGGGLSCRGAGQQGQTQSINDLAASFMAALQADNASRQHTVLRTALKLQPFAFNRSPGEQEQEEEETGICHTMVERLNRRGRGNLTQGEEEEEAGGRHLTVERENRRGSRKPGPATRDAHGETAAFAPAEATMPGPEDRTVRVDAAVPATIPATVPAMVPAAPAAGDEAACTSSAVPLCCICLAPMQKGEVQEANTRSSGSRQLEGQLASEGGESGSSHACSWTAGMFMRQWQAEGLCGEEPWNVCHSCRIGILGEPELG